MEGRKRSRDEIISEIACKKMEIAALEEEAEKLKKDSALNAAKQIMRRIKNISISTFTFVYVSFDDTDLTLKLSYEPLLTIEGAKVYDVIDPADFHMLHILYDQLTAKETLAANMQLVLARNKNEYAQKMSLFLAKIYAALAQYFVALEDHEKLRKFRKLWYIAIAK